MAATRLSDLIVPEVFNRYVVERTAELSAFWQSGVVMDVPDITPGSRGGATVQMPFFKDLDGDDELLDEDDTIAVNNIQSGQDVSVVHARAKAWGATDLSAAFTGEDPMAAIGNLVADYWQRRYQTALIQSLNGAAAVVTDNVHDISGLSGGAAIIDGASFIDATQKMGDAKTRITAVAMHSATEAWLAKNDLIDFIEESQQAPQVPFFQGKRVIVDDGMPVASPGIYTTYLFGAGAVGWAPGTTPVPTETHREPAAGGGQDQLFTRRHFVLHPRGVKWDPASGVPAKQTPSNTELADEGNWTRVYESKNIRIVKFVHLLG